MSRFRDRGSLFWVAVGLFVLYLYLLGIPLLAVIIGSFVSHGTTLLGTMQFENWIETYNTTRPVLVTTLIYSFGTATLTTAIACGLSWAIARTNVPYGRVFYLLSFVGFLFPPVAWEITWIRLMGGGGTYAALLGIDSLGVESLPGMILIASVRFFPLGMVLLVPLFSSMDKTLEDASQISGAGTLRTLKDITLQMLRPGIFAVYLLVFILSLGSFRVPLLIGAPHGIEVLSLTIYQNVSADPLSYGQAMTQSVMLVALALPCLYLYKRSLGQTKKFATVSGRGYARNPVDIGKWRYVLFSGLSAFFLFAIIVPTLMIIYTSLLPYYIPPQSLQSFDLFTLDAYWTVFSNERIQNSLGNSLFVAAAATSLLVIGSIVNAWIVQKTDISFRHKLDYLSFASIGIPPIPLAVGMLFIYLLFIPGGDIIYNSLFILIIAMYTRFIAGTIRVIEPGIIQLKRELLEAGRISGDSMTSRLRYIIFPLIKENAQAAWAMRFSVIFLELPVATLLGSRQTEMVAPVLVTLQNQAQFTQVAAFGVVIMTCLGLITIIIHRL